MGVAGLLASWKPNLALHASLDIATRRNEYIIG